MPSRKLTSHCPQCGSKNHLRAAHCNHCGLRLKDDRAIKDAEGRAKLYADIAHPINSECREMIQARVIEEFRLEKDRAKQPGYVSRYDDFDIDDSHVSKSHRTHFQPAAKEPRPPHQPTSSPSPSTSQGEDGPNGSGFGAGIL